MKTIVAVAAVASLVCQTMAFAQSTPPPTTPTAEPALSSSPETTPPERPASASTAAPAPSVTATTPPSQPAGDAGLPTQRVDSTKEGAPPATAPAFELPFRLYGILISKAVFSGHGVETFGQPNASATTAAGNPVLTNLPNESRLTFQAAQSRFGLWIGEKLPVRGQIEFDFIDFTKASPTVASVPRVRIAKIESDFFDKKLLVIMGQDWDLFQPVNHPGINLVGGAFTNGNTAFMRQQLKLLYTLGQIEVGAAVGLQAPNVTAKDAAVELSRMPTFAARVAYLPNAKSKVGISGIATSLRFAPETPNERRAFAGSGGIFGDITPSPLTNFRFEGYIARNLQNLGALALGTGNVLHDIDEFGGFASFRQGLGSDVHWVYTYAGIAHVMNDGVLSPSYSGEGATAVAAGTGFGIRQNISAHLGYELKPYTNLSFIAEGFWYRTHHKLQAADAATIDGDRKAAGAEIGMMLTF